MAAPRLSSTPPKPVRVAPDQIDLDMLGRFVQGLVTEQGWEFSCEGQACTHELGKKDGLLPLWLWRAEKTYADIWSPEAPVVAFTLESSSLLGVVPLMEGKGPSQAVWSLLLHHELEAWMQANKPVPGQAAAIDGLFASWLEAADANLLPLRQAPTPQEAPAPGPEDRPETQGLK